MLSRRNKLRFKRLSLMLKRPRKFRSKNLPREKKSSKMQNIKLTLKLQRSLLKTPPRLRQVTMLPLSQESRKN